MFGSGGDVMDERSRLALLALGTAVLLGALADALLRVGTLGLGASVWIAALLVAVALLAAKRVPPLMGEGRAMAIPALLFAAFLAWRDSPTLKTMDVCACAVSLGLMAWRSEAGQLRMAAVTEYAVALGCAAWECAAGAYSAITKEVGWDRIPRGKWTRAAGAAGRGVLIALPLLLVFGWLLSSADAVFAGYLRSAASVDVSGSSEHVAFALICAWVVAGFLYVLLLREEPAKETASLKIPRLGTIEVGTALGLIDLLFLAFVLVQMKYLFGGDQRVQAIDGLTYAQYARSGFFELVWAAILALPMLMGAHSVLDTSRKTVRLAFNGLAGLLIGLLLVVLASAAERMRLYQAAYGLTELRFYVSAFIVWLAALFVWFCATVIRGRRDRFAFGGLVSAMLGVLVLHAVNPDATIARANIERAKHGKRLDVANTASLSADALPVLADALLGPRPASSEVRNGAWKHALVEALETRWRKRLFIDWTESVSPYDWRSWSYGRFEGSRAAERIAYGRAHGAFATDSAKGSLMATRMAKSE
jgi:hypothetical protein